MLETAEPARVLAVSVPVKVALVKDGVAPKVIVSVAESPRITSPLTVKFLLTSVLPVAPTENWTVPAVSWTFKTFVTPSLALSVRATIPAVG